MKKEDNLFKKPILDYADIEKLKILDIACKTTNFSEAAKNLNMVPSSVSKAIAALEKKFGFQLFNRKPHTVEATPEAKDLIKYIKKIFTSLDDLDDYLNIKDTEAAGRLKIYGGDNSLATLVIESVDSFKDNYPNLELDIIGTNEIPHFLPSQLMVGLFGPISHQPKVIQNYLMSFNLGLYASADYLNKYGNVESIEDLNKHHLIVFDNHGIPFSYVDNWLLEVGQPAKSRRKPYLIMNTVPLTSMAVQKGLGIALIQRESYFIKHTKLIELLPHVSKPALKIFCSYHSAYKNNPSILAFESQIKKVIQDKGWH